MARTLAIASFVAIAALQIIWHALLPEPTGNRNWILSAVAVLPLLLLIRGVVSANVWHMTMGGYLLILYFVIGVMESWSNTDQRVPALIQVLLSVAYIISLVMFTQQLKSARSR